MPSTKKGFNLLEVLIVLVIIAAILAYAYPKYINHVTTTRRLDGKVAILDLASKMNDYYVAHHNYENADFILLNTSESSPEGYYQLKIVKATKNSYEIQSIPIGSQAKHDTLCGSFTYNQAGEKGITGNGAITECWWYGDKENRYFIIKFRYAQ